MGKKRERKRASKTFTDKEISEYSFEVTVIRFIIEPEGAAVMEVGCELRWVATA